MNWACTKEGYGYLGQIVLCGSGRKKRGSRGADNIMGVVHCTI